MKVACVLLLALLSLGFIVETPEGRREVERQHKTWRKQFKRAYDLTALQAFLVEQVKATGEIEGVDLSKSRLAAQWSLEGGVAQCGDWLFIGKVGDAEFALQWTYADIPHPDHSGGIWKIIQLHCRREAKDRFRQLSVSRSEDEYVILMP
jgi:hypothetical protein